MLRLLSVTDLNRYLAELIGTDPILPDLWVEGEVFDFRAAQSGHWYFKLRHGDASISAACWRSSVAKIAERPQNGDGVLAHGRVGFYEANGSLQLYVDALRPAGVGLLHAQFERLRQQLEDEGLFEPSRKRPLPPLPGRIGVATSPTGAALQDILKVIRRRYPLTEVIVAPCAVQGSQAADTIVEALYALYAANVDVIILARGGGSAEDLWAFNEEAVARAVFASPVPLVTGVGHETDTTIVDYVADLRAPTPSAAAELVTPAADALPNALAEARARLADALQARLADARAELAAAERRLTSAAPLNRLARDRQRLDDLQRRAAAALAARARLSRARLEGISAQLEALSPQRTLNRGYAVVQLPGGAAVTAPDQIDVGAAFVVTLRDGTLTGQRT